MWRIYYGDGTCCSSEDGQVPPARDVQVIVQEEPTVGFYMQSGSDYYVLRDGLWVGVDIFGLFDYLLDLGTVLFGRTIRPEEYEAIFQRAKQEMPIRKSAWLPKERQA